jgi:DNA-binding MarR family transcriptional regulator
VTDLTRVFFDLVHSETRLYNALDQRLRAEHGLAASQLGALRIIGGRDDCRVGDLAREAAITVGATSKVVDRLEAAGWVSRRPNPANRRSSLLALTVLSGRAQLRELKQQASHPRSYPRRIRDPYLPWSDRECELHREFPHRLRHATGHAASHRAHPALLEDGARCPLASG